MPERRGEGVSMNIKLIIRGNIKELLFIFLAFFFMVLVSFFFVSTIVEKQVRSNADEVFHVAEAVIRSNIREAEIVLLSAVETVQYKLDTGQSPQTIQDYVGELTAWLFKPENSISGLTDIRGYIRGQYIDGVNWRPPETYVPWERPWYTGALAAGDSIVYSEPYDDPRSGKLVITLSKAVKSSAGDIYGVLVIPVDMVVIVDYVKNLQFAEGGYGMLVDQQLVFIAHPDEKNLNKPLAGISKDHAEIARDLMAGESAISVARAMNTRGIGVVLSFRRLFNGWYIGIATPVFSYYKTVYIMAAVLSLLGLAFMSVLSFFLIRLNMAKQHSDEENKSKSSFLARMSHEIRTPMNSILGMTELLLRKDISPEIDDYLSIINQAGQTLLTIINDILDFSKITSGQFKIEPRKYRFSSMINDTINVIRMRFMDKPLDFLVTVDSGIPAELIGDDVRVRQILINLLNNAIKYTSEGYVALDIRRGAASGGKLELVLSVSDSGAGIKAEDMDRLFSDFTRLDINNNYHIEGTGLGLAITHTLCQAMGGRIGVSSEYGKGSTFTAVIAQSFEDDKKLAQVNEPEKKRILFFEDRPLVFESIEHSFHNLDLNPVGVREFPEFIAELEKREYDYAFVSSKRALDCIHVLGKEDFLTQLVILVELGDVSFFREVKSIMMPVYALPIANVLNNVSEEEIKTLRLRFSFTAPAAKVLIVDDISSNLRVAKELMAPYKMEVHTCLSGAEAIKLVRQNRYDIVFMDHMMPGMDGLEAAAAIRALAANGDDYFRKLPVIALTANAVSGQQELFFQRGLNDFIAKPIEVKQLDAILERWVPPGKKITAEPEERAESEAAVNMKIPGIDIAAGLRNVSGSPAVYMDILEEYCRNVEDLALRIRRARKEGSTGLYADSMHALKGVSRSIGALDLGNFAEQLEKAAKIGDGRTIEQRTDDLLGLIKTLTDNINTAAAGWQTEREPPEETDLSLLRLDLLKNALVTLDIDAVNKMMVEYLSIPLDSAAKTGIDTIEQHILMYEYDKAIEAIDRMLGS
jgi:signal transduction histidine kinase/CheY-like chemotaxis protein